MNVKIRTPKGGLSYQPPKKIDYKITTFRLPEEVLKELQKWVDDVNEDGKGSLNDLVREILEWGIKYRKNKR